MIDFDKNCDIKVSFLYEGNRKIPSFLINSKVFEGKLDQSYIDVKSKRVYIGLGNKKSDKMALFKSVVSGIKSLEKLEYEKIYIDLKNISKNDIFFVVESVFFASHSLSMKSKDIKKEKTFVFDHKFGEIVERAHTIASVRNYVRDLVDMPSNILTTKGLVDSLIERLNNLKNLDIEVWDYNRIIAEKMEGIISVGKGSSNKPYFVKIKYEPKSYTKTVSLIGKGIVFDSGGLSLKSSDSMLDMKGDMAGAATVIGLIELATRFNIPLKINAYIPIAENMVSGSSYKIGDVIKYKNGKTVEITNTDAEGRLILADAIIEANNDDSHLIIVIATLTGACMVALGTSIYGVFLSNDRIGKEMVDFINIKTSEKAWLLPLFEPYKENLKSKICDLKNSASTRWGGAINAALFLKDFVDKKEFIHLDIAGPFYDDGIGLIDKMATGIPLESLFLFLSSKMELLP